jgi:hypothetical protein
MGGVPKILHYCFGFSEDFGGKPWGLVHYVCAKSAVEQIKPEKAFIYFEYEPGGVWWELTKSILQPVQIYSPREIFGKRLNHVAHRADVLRLQILLRHGGIYLDADVFVHRGFDKLLGYSAVLGQQDGKRLCNAVILAEPNASFLQRWYDEYRWFRSIGMDQYWDEHSCRVPLALAKANPRELTILPHTAFYSFLWSPEHLRVIFASVGPSCERATFANHLWELKAWDDYLEHLTPGKVRKIDSNFHRWARPYVANLPDDFGAPKLRDRLARLATKFKSRCLRGRWSRILSARHTYQIWLSVI